MLIIQKSAYHGADISHSLKYLHLSTGLTPLCILLTIYSHHVWAPKRSKVVHWHQILLTLISNNVQMTNLTKNFTFFLTVWITVSISATKQFTTMQVGREVQFKFDYLDHYKTQTKYLPLNINKTSNFGT